MEDLNNLTIEGNGSDFIFHGRMQPFTINNSHHITIKNINIDQIQWLIYLKSVI
jgi:hypothetical protein